MTAAPRLLLAVLWVGTLCVAGCMPTHAAFLRLGVTFPDGNPPGLAILDVPLLKLQARNPDLDPQQLAVYYMGRDPVSHQLWDKDRDGRPDHVRVKILAKVDEAWLVFVSPGTPSPEPLPAGGQAVRVTYHFRR
jgi:hypothetical protein